MRAIYWVMPGLLAGRPGPGEVPWNLEELWAVGLRAILSLSAEVDEEAIGTAGFYHGRFYFPPILVPIRPLMGGFLSLMEGATGFIQAQLAAGRPTLVHCHAGKDRTGAVLAGYLVRYRGFSADEAVRLVRQANPRAMTAPGFERLPGLFMDSVRLRR
ncbi:MAG: dual specificity protein phosphatase family protein [Anaerolineae bacterium]